MRPTSSLLSGPAVVTVPSRDPDFVVVGLDAEAYERLRAALEHVGRGALEVRRVPCWHQVEWADQRERRLTVVFDPFMGELEPLGEMSARHPCLRLVAYGRLTPACAGRLGEVLRAGIVAFVTRDVDDTPAGFAYHLQRAGLLGEDASG